MPVQKPSFRDLEPEEIEEMLRTHEFGRLAFSFHDRVDIEPIHFVYDDGWIYGRTTRGTKLRVLAHHPWVAFEIDDVRGLFEWRSVVAKGTVYFTDPDGGSELQAEYQKAVTILRRLVPDAFTENDPVPARTIVFRIHVDVLHGRAAELKG